MVLFQKKKCRVINMAFLRIKAKKIEKVIQKLLFCVSESLRSTKKLHLVFLSRSEARKNSIWSFWVAQKHRNLLFPYLCRWQKRLFSLFRAYVVDRSDYFSPFALSETFRSMKNLHLPFLKRSEAWKSSICPFWNVQKHKKPPFALSETFRSTKTRKLFARLPYNLYFCMQMKIYLT